MIVLVVGDFCVGKDTFADMLIDELKDLGYNELKDVGVHKILSYTTRERREGEVGTHEFCTREEFLGFDDLIAQTKIGDDYYGARACQFETDDINIYIVDSKGVADVLAYGLDAVYIIEVIRPKWLIKCSKARQNRERHYKSEYYIDYRVLNDADLIKLQREARECSYNIANILASNN